MYHEKQHLQHCLKHTLNNLLQCEAFKTQQLNAMSDEIGARRTWILGNYDANLLSAALLLHKMEVKWLDPRDADPTSLGLLQVHQQHQQSSNNKAADPTTCTDAASTQHNAAEQQQTQQHQAGCHQTAQSPKQLSCLQSGTEHSETQVPGHSQMQDEPADPINSHSTLQVEQKQQPDCTQSDFQPGLVGLVVNVAARGWWSTVFGGRHWLTLKHLQGQWWNLDSRLSAPESFMVGDTDACDGGTHRLQQYLQQQMAEGALVMAVYYTAQEVQQGLHDKQP